MMSVLYVLLLKTKLYLRKREREKFVVKISKVFFFGFSSVVVLFFKPQQEGVFMRSVCAIKSFVYI